MVYRNIYFKGSIMTKGKGSTDVYYSGHLFSNAKSIKDFASKYDKSQDLYIDCSDCASRNYRNFIKVNQ